MSEVQSASPAGEIAIRVEDVWRIYQVDGRKVPALQGITLQLAAGQLVALKGRSGSGKTTLLNCLGGLDAPTSGSVQVFGKELRTLDEASITEWRRKEVGFIFQSFGLLPTLTAYENVELMLRIAGVAPGVRHTRTLECLKRVGLAKWIHHRPYEMSGGQQQRVAIARAIANRPRLILADEATGELDSQTSREMLTFFKKIVDEEGVTFLVASHDALVDEYADRVVIIRDGRVE